MASIENENLGIADIVTLTIITSLASGQITFLIRVIRSVRENLRTQPDNWFFNSAGFHGKLTLAGWTLTIGGLSCFIASTATYVCGTLMTKNASTLEWLIVGILAGPLVAIIGAVLVFISSYRLSIKQVAEPIIPTTRTQHNEAAN